MPIYEYRCENCQNTFEVLTTSADTEKLSCNKCGSGDVSKLISAGSIRRGVGAALPSAGSQTSGSGCSHRGFS